MPQLPLAPSATSDDLRQAYDLPASAQHVRVVQVPTGPGRWARTLCWIDCRQLFSYNATTGHFRLFARRTPEQRELGEFTEPLDAVAHNPDLGLNVDYKNL